MPGLGTREARETSAPKKADCELEQEIDAFAGRLSSTLAQARRRMPGQERKAADKRARRVISRARIKAAALREKRRRTA